MFLSSRFLCSSALRNCNVLIVEHRCAILVNTLTHKYAINYVSNCNYCLKKIQIFGIYSASTDILRSFNTAFGSSSYTGLTRGTDASVYSI